MTSDAEPAKLLLPFLQRADELQKHELLVAYYCRLYAMERGLKIPQKERTKTTNALLTSLMNQLEKDKKALKLSAEDHLYLEGFATNVFTKADKQDRAGRADLNTAKTFYAASIFFEILNQFGELQPDIEQKLKYAVWKAADIRKALKEGRKPEPGPPGGDKDLLDPSTPQTNINAQDSNESFQTNFPAQTSSDHIEQQDFATRKSVDYSGADAPHLPSYKDPMTENINYSGATLPSHPADQGIGRGDGYIYSGSNASPSSYPSQAYSPSSYQHFPQPYSQNYTNPYSYEQQPLTYPNFQSYPSFQESTFPPAPTHQPSYSHETLSPPHLSNYHQSTAHYSSPNDGGSLVGSSSVSSAPAPAPAPAADTYKYDGKYQPPVEKIAEAHKVARFAVGALAFDDVAVAVDFLRRSLELLTNPSAETQ